MFSNSKWFSNFYRLFIGQGLATLLTTTVNYCLIFYLTDKFKSASLLTIAQLVSLIPIALFSPLSGVLVDRFNKKMLLIVSDLLVAGITLLLFIKGISSGGILTVNTILISNALRASAMSIQNPAIQASVPNLVPDEKLLSINGQYSSLQAINQLLPPVLGALAYGAISINNVLLLSITANLLGMFSVVITKFPKISTTREYKVLLELKTAVNELKQNQGLFHLLIFKVISIAIIMPTTVLYPLMTTEYFKGSIKTDVPIVEVSLSLGMMIAGFSLTFLSSKYNKLLSALVGISLISGIFTLSALLPSNKLGFIIFVMINFIAGMGIPIIEAPIQTLIQQKISNKNLGKVISFYLMMIGISGPLGLVVGSVWSRIVPINVMFLTSGILLIVLIFFVVRDKAILQDFKK